MAMNKDFADWYRSASVVPPAELLESRWKGVEDATSALTSSNLQELLRLFVIKPAPNFEVPDFLDASFRKHDASLSRRSIEEFRVLAGAILRNSIEKDSAFGVVSALGLSAANYGSRRASAIVPEHVIAAERYLTIKAVAVREAKAIPLVKVSATTKEKFAEIVPAEFFENADTDPLFNLSNEQNTKLNQGLLRLSTALWKVIRFQREELNLLWWLQAKLSRDLAIPFGAIDRAQAAAVFPMEIADLTGFVPGPPSILGIIITSLSDTKNSNKKVSIAEIVNSMPRHWREARTKESHQPEIGAICPVTFAISKSLETDGDKDWIPIYKKQCEIAVDEEGHARDLALQIYRERMFSRALAELRE